MLIHEELTREIIGAAIAVHRALGPGLLESSYEEALCRELEFTGLSYERQVELPISYRGAVVGQPYVMDIVVEQLVILELKSVKKIVPLHDAQLLTYLTHSELPVGFLMNFNVPVLTEGGIRRKVLTRSARRSRK